MLPLLLTLALSAPQQPDHVGTDFVLAFPESLYGDPEAPDPLVRLTGETATTGTVEIPGLSFSQPFSVTPGTVTEIVLPAAARVVGSDVFASLGVLVSAQDPISVVGLIQGAFATDGYLALPSDELGTEYTVLTYNENVSTIAPVITGRSHFTIVGVQTGTLVTILPTATTGARSAGLEFSIFLQPGDVYQLQTDSPLEDLSGTVITADRPVAVLSGSPCATVPDSVPFCSPLVEQLTPTSTWGRCFFVTSLATRTGGDVVRVIARDANTAIQTSCGFSTLLSDNEWTELSLASFSMCHIEATGPILVMQYSKSAMADQALADPFMVQVLPTRQFLERHTFFTPAESPVAYDNWINVVVPTHRRGSLQLDGAIVPGTAFSPGSNGYVVARIQVTAGAHTLTCAEPVGVTVYGFEDGDGYGYPGGMGLAEIADDPFRCGRGKIKRAPGGSLPSVERLFR